MVKPKTVSPILKELLGHSRDCPDEEFMDVWKRITSSICKPCWELKYCPFGPMVEEFPLIPPTRQEAIQSNQEMKDALAKGLNMGGRPLNKWQKNNLPKMVKEFDESDYPELTPDLIKDAECRIFGHMCPVYFVAEPFTETKAMRRTGRQIPRDIMLKVVRRDGQMCQICNQYVPDNELEFDHVIPHDKGGPITVENLRVVHSSCNKKKSNTLDHILDPVPLSKHVAEDKEE